MQICHCDNSMQLLTGFEDNSSFVWPENGSVAEATGWGPQICSRVKQNCCCPRSQSRTVLLYTIIFFKIFLFTLFTHLSIRCLQHPGPSSQRIWKTPWHCDINITWLIEPMKIRPSVNSSIAGNRWMNCWPVNRTVLQPIGILLLTVKILCIYCIAFIQEKKYNNIVWYYTSLRNLSNYGTIQNWDSFKLYSRCSLIYHT